MKTTLLNLLQVKKESYKSWLLFSILLIGPFIRVSSQPFTATYNFGSVASGSGGYTDPTAVPTASGVTFGSFTAVGFTTSNPSARGRFSFTGNPLGATTGSDVFAGSFPTGQYYQVTVTVTGSSVNLTGITFIIQRSGTGVRQFSVRSDADSYASNLAASESVAALSVVPTNIFQITDATTAATTGSTITLSGASFTGLTAGASRTFRFYGWNAEAAGGTFSIDDVIISGTSAVSSPTINVTGSFNKFYANESVLSDPQSVAVTGSALSGNLIVGPLVGYEFATTPGGAYGPTLTLVPSSGSVSQTVYVRLTDALAAGTYTGSINFASSGATTVTRTPSGQVYANPLTGFAAGNIVTLRVGETAGPALSNASSPIFLDEYTTSGTFVKSVALPFAVNLLNLNRRFSMSGTATSEGYLNLSPDGQYLTFAGYDAAPGVTGIASTPSSTTNRIVARVSQNGTINTTTRINDGYDANNIRSAATVDGSGFWTGGPGGATGGTRYMPLGNTGTSTQVSSTVTNTRGTAIYNSQLYSSASSGSNTGVNSVGTGLPTTSGNTTAIIPGLTTGFAPNAHGFVFVDTDDNGTPDVMYVADATSGLMKFSNTAGTWTARGTLPNPAGRAVYGVTADLIPSTTNRRIILNLGTGSTIATEIYSFVDNSAVTSNIASSGTDIITACGSPIITSPNATNVGFKGVSFVPVDVPTPTINHTFTSAGTTITQGAVNTPLYRIQCDITVGNALLTGVTVATAGSYAGSDVENFRLIVSNDATLDGGDVVLSTINTSTGAGQTLAFTGLGQNLPVGTTRYLFVTASISGCAAVGGAINITSTPLTNITYSNPAAVKNGTPLAGTSKSIVSGTLANVTGLTASSGAPTVQVSWTNPSCFDQILIVAHTANITGTPSGTVYTSNLNYSLAPAFAGGGKVVYYGSASPQFITGLVSGTTYNVKVFVRKSASWSSGVQVSATPQNPTFYSVASGVAGSGAIWSLTPAGAPATAATLGGFTVNTSVVIQNGHTVTFSSSNVNYFNLTVDAGGAITAGGTGPIYMNINGNAITNNGTIGTIANDGISFNIEGVNVVFGGSGVNNVARIRKRASTNTTSTLVINSNVNVSFAGSAVYNDADNTNLNVTINALKSLNLTATGGVLGDFTFDGTDGASTGERGGVLTVNGTLNMTGRLIAVNNNTNAIYGSGIVINGGGRIFCKDVDINTATGTGFPITIAASGRLSVSGKMRMLGGTFAANNNVVFNSGAVLLHGAGTFDGATACSGTVTGAIQYRRQGALVPYPSAEYNYWSSPVINSTAGVIMGSQTGANAFSFNPLLATGVTQAGLLPCWTSVTTATTMAQGKGYISTNAGLVTFTGVPYEGTLGVPLTGNLFTKFNLVGNPYPSSVSATSLLAGNSGQIVPALHFWDDDNSAGAGFSPADYVVVNTLGATGGNGSAWTGQIAAGQSFFVEGATTSNTFTFNNAMRNANAATFFEDNADLKRIWISLSTGENADSETMLAFLPEATNGYDLNYDAQRMSVNSSLSVSTLLNNNFYAIQAWPAIDATQIIQLSVNATQAAIHQIQISGIDNIDASVLVFLEDMQTGSMHNLRSGAYTFEGNANLANSNRFRIRFSKPTTFVAEGESCDGFDGKININSQNGVWNFNLSDANGQTIASGTTEDEMQFENLDGGDYIMQLVHNNYEVAMNITVASSQTVDALIMSSDVAYAMEPKSFAVVASNATEIVWNFGDGSEVLLGESVTHTYEQAGVYTLNVTASNDECSYGVYQTVEVLTPNVTGMEATAKNIFRMLPNPAQSTLTFVKVGSSIATIEIVDLSGKVVARETLSSTAQTIDISALASGVYSVTFTQDAVYAVQKLVVQK